MAATKAKLLKIADELFEKRIIGTGMLRGKKYDICNGHIQFSVRSCNPNTWSRIWKNFEKLGYTVKSGGYSYMDVYWDEDTSTIDQIFEKYE